MTRGDERRPATVTLLGLVLAVAALVSAGSGLLATWASNCCGSAEAEDPGPALLGLGVAGCLAAAAFGLLGGSMDRRLVVVLAAALPVACLVAAPSSSDLGALAPVTLLGWGGFTWFLHRPAARAWLDRQRSRGVSPS